MKLIVLLLSTLGAIIPSLEDEVDEWLANKIEYFPYLISLHYEGSHSCGGSILSEDTILTAAHCVIGKNYDDFTVRVGSLDNTNGEEFKVTEIIEHEDYFKGAQYNNDVAVLKLDQPLTFSAKVQPILLQPSGMPVPAQTSAIMGGWGTTENGETPFPTIDLVHEMEVIDWKKCRQLFIEKNNITESMLCAEAWFLDSCLGYSGSPLVVDKHLIGVLSWGLCNADEYTGVFADVGHLHEFVSRYM